MVNGGVVEAPAEAAAINGGSLVASAAAALRVIQSRGGGFCGDGHGERLGDMLLSRW